MTTHPREQLMAYADGELSAAAAAEVESHLRGCTECTRELAIVRNLKGAMQEMQTTRNSDIWYMVNRRLARPAGWILICVALVFWIGLAAVRWFQNELTIEWLTGSALLTGLGLLVLSIGHEQYRQWKLDRYKDVER